MHPSDVDALVLVGADCKLPGVANLVSELLGQEPVGNVDPLTAVAEGAAIAAAILTGELEGSGIYVTTDHALGTVVANPVTGNLEFNVIIPRNHKIPAKVSTVMRPDVDYQETVQVVLMEGDPDVPIGHADNVVIWDGEVRIPNPRPRDEVTLELIYEYDVAGVLWVTAREVECGAVILDRMPITFGVTKDRVAGAPEGANDLTEPASRTSVKHTSGTRIDDQDAQVLLHRAQEVIPYLDDAHAQVVSDLVRAVIESANDRGAACRDLEAELQKHRYLF